MAELVDILRGPGVRLLTLTGVGGTGKTRLAIELAAHLQDHYADGVVFVSLASITDPAHVSPAIAQAMGIRETADAPLMELLIAGVLDRELLLVVDNLEHVLDAASVIAALITACPRLTVLATSRAPLKLTLEREVHVPPLELPESVIAPLPNDVGDVASVRFFEEKARAVVPGFAVTPANAGSIAEICRRLDGLPLAILLAASRSRVLEPAELLTRLDRRLTLLTGGQRDVPERQRTMRDTIGWSHDLLMEHEHIVFRRLSIFVGGFTLETAEAMSHEFALLHPGHGAPAFPRTETPVLLLDALETLIDHHLIEREEPPGGGIRFGMLETIREYALERLEASGEAEMARAAHAAAITAWAERAKPLMFGADQDRWLAQGTAEQPNIRAALKWTLERGDTATAHRLAAANGPIWLKRTMLREAERWLHDVLALSGPAPVEAVTVCRFIASSVAAAQGANDLALQHAKAGFTLAREAGDTFGEGLALMMQSGLLLKSDLDGAEKTNEAALACFLTVPGRPRVASCLLQRVTIAQLRGDYVQSTELAKKAYDYSVDVEDTWSIAVALVIRAEAAYLNREFAAALAHIEEAIAIAQQIESSEILAWALQMAAVVASACGDHRVAVRWMDAAGAAITALGGTSEGMVVQWLSTARSNATKAIGQKAVEIEAGAARNVPLLVVADEVHHYRPGKGASGIASPLGLARLTSREEEVLRLIASGLTDVQIGEVLFIARPTVSKHVSNILAKLDVTSRTAAVDTAHRLGLIDSP